jgi:micrococcal nuclease
MTRSRRRRSDIWPRLHRRHPFAALLVLVLIALVVRGRVEAPAGSDHDRYHDKTFTCIYVADGDTVDIDAPDADKAKTRIRLWGVDTPETSKSPQGEMYYGPEASAFTTSLVLNRRVRILLSPNRSRDRYGRLLAYVYPEGSDTMLNESLVIEGYAYADPRFPHEWKARFQTLEARARKAGAGLWANLRPEQMPAWRQRSP